MARMDRRALLTVAFSGPVGNTSVTLLGGFGAAVDGVAVPASAWRLKKARELVKLLGLAPAHSLHREQAMDLLWGDRPPDAAANNLHQAVFVARRALETSAIEVRDEMLQLVADVDVEAFQLAAADARRARTPAAYRAALSVYGGELLPENRYDDWADEQRGARRAGCPARRGARVARRARRREPALAAG
jgi:DNA-binding SARP family transcriptional activator